MMRLRVLPRHPHVEPHPDLQIATMIHHHEPKLRGVEKIVVR